MLLWVDMSLKTMTEKEHILLNMLIHYFGHKAALPVEQFQMSFD